MNHGNSLFLICKPCEVANERDFGVQLAERPEGGWYQHRVPSKQFEAWLVRHKNCGGRGNPDHFGLAYQFEHNHDQAKFQPDAVEVVN